MITVSDYIFKFLKENNTKDIFMLSGGGCMYLCDSLGKSNIDYTCCLNEQAVTIAALGYAQYKDDIGVALVTSGPGATNAITGVMAAWTESVPLLILSGQVKTQDFAKISGVRTRGVQEAPIIDIVSPITKYAVTITNPSDIKYHLEKSFFLAKNQRQGPVWLDIPLDVQSAMIDEDSLKSFVPLKQNNNDLSRDIKKTIQMMMDAKRPVILAGYGIRLSKKIGEFLKLIEKLNIPVLTTWKAADIIYDNHPLFMGRPGIAGQRTANFIQQNSDLIIVLGARLDFPQTGFNQSLFARQAKKIIVDIDQAELKKFDFDIDVPICVDVGEFICSLNKQQFLILPQKEWLDQCNKWKERYKLVLEEHYHKKDFASLYVLVEAISNVASKNDLIVPGSSGMGSDVPYQTVKIKEGQRLFNSPGLGSMGFGIPSALGACIASGEKRVICINGDGGFQMNIQELQTIKSHNLPIKFFVINNNGYASIRNTQRNYFQGFYVGSSPESGVSLPDITKLAKAYDYHTFSISSNDDINGTIKNVLECDGPAICEVIIDPNDTLCFKASSHIRPDGSAVSTPVEDLYPFLLRREFYENMYIKPINRTGVNICNILFDLDGTIIDSKSGIIASMKYALKNNGVSDIFDNDISGAIGLSLTGMIKKLLPNVDETKFNEIFKLYRKYYAEKGVYDCFLYDNMAKTLQILSKEFNLYIVTSKSLDMAKEALKHLKIDKYFIDIKGVESGITIKNKSVLIKDLLEERSLNAYKSLMIGDKYEDIQAAKENNIKTVAVDYGYGTVDELREALVIAKSSDELVDILF